MATQNHDFQPICPPKWTWLLAGIAIGLFISFLIYLKVAPHNAPEIAQPSSTEAQTSQPVDNSPTDNFQFEEPKVEENTTAPAKYVLQVGSFKKEQQANGLKEYLASLGVPATTTIDETDNQYKVQVGPFTNLDELNKTRDLLAKNNISAIQLEL